MEPAADVRPAEADGGAPPAPDDPSPASTRATTPAGELTITGLTGHARHIHGGNPARLGRARFRVENHGSRPIRLQVDRVEFLTGRSCELPPSEVESEPSFGGMMTEDGSMTESVEALDVPPGVEVTIVVGFVSVSAYYVWCNRFAFRVHFRADGQPVTTVAETKVVRVTPLRNVE